MDRRLTVHFAPTGEETGVEPGTTILQAGAPFGFFLNASCGGKGRCGKCKVQVIEGDLEVGPEEERFLSPEELARGVRLACDRRIFHNTRVYIIEERDDATAKLRSVADDEIAAPVDTGTSAHYLEGRDLTPAEADTRPLWTRMTSLLPPELRSLPVDPGAYRSLSLGLMETGATVLVTHGEIVGVESGDRRKGRYGAAIDIGTTTIACYLLDLADGATIAATAATNPQRAWGGDVMSRINYAMTDPEGLGNLKNRAAAAINEIVGRAAADAAIPVDRIDVMTLVGNSAMHHLFFGIDPSSLGLAPYLPIVHDGIAFKPSVHGLDLSLHARAYFLPCVAGFVGADTVGVMLSIDLDQREGVTLALDIGTNGETVLGNRDRIVCGSNAAGPAFEGAGIRQGMRAIPGAIGKVEIMDGQIRIGTIGAVPARGLCGSGLIDAVAELRRVGVIDPTGRMVAPEELDGRIRDSLAERIVAGDSGNDMVLAGAEEGYQGREVRLTQRDVREVQLAAGAIAAGRKVLAHELGVDEAELAEVLLAGAFGNYIRPQSAVRVGLIPNLPAERIRFIGNAAGRGARLALISQAHRRKAERLKEEVDFVEFAGRMDFQEYFVDAMIFPEDV